MSDRELQVSISSYSGHKEATTAEDGNSKANVTGSVDQKNKEMSLEDVMNQDREVTLATVEQLQNLAGSGDMKVLFCAFVFYIDPE